MLATMKIICRILVLCLLGIISFTSLTNADDLQLRHQLKSKSKSYDYLDSISKAGMPVVRLKSEVQAVAWSTLGTFVPIAAGVLTWHMQKPRHIVERDSRGYVFWIHDENPDRTIPIAMIISGLAIGPSLGYFYGGCPDRGITGIGVRVGLGGLTALGSVAMFQATHTDGGFVNFSGVLEGLAVAGLGTVVIAGDAIYDIAKVKGTVRAANQKHLLSSISLAPTLVGQNNVPGMALTMIF